MAETYPKLRTCFWTAFDKYGGGLETGRVHLKTFSQNSDLIFLISESLINIRNLIFFSPQIQILALQFIILYLPPTLPTYAFIWFFCHLLVCVSFHYTTINTNNQSSLKQTSLPSNYLVICREPTFPHEQAHCDRVEEKLLDSVAVSTAKQLVKHILFFIILQYKLYPT